MQNISGLRSCYDKVGRLIYFGRMLDKIRLHAASKLPPDYAENLGERQVHARRALLPFPRRPLFGDKKTHARRRARRSRPETGRTPTAPRAPTKSATSGTASLPSSAGATKRSHVLPQRIQESGLTGKPIETLIDHIESDEGRDPSPRGFGKRSEGDSRACQPHRGVVGVAGLGKGIEIGQVEPRASPRGNPMLGPELWRDIVYLLQLFLLATR